MEMELPKHPHPPPHPGADVGYDDGTHCLHPRIDNGKVLWGNQRGHTRQVPPATHKHTTSAAPASGISSPGPCISLRSLQIRYCTQLHAELTAHVFPKRPTMQAKHPLQKALPRPRRHRNDMQTLHCHHWLANQDECRAQSCPYAHVLALNKRHPRSQ